MGVKMSLPFFERGGEMLLNGTYIENTIFVVLLLWSLMYYSTYVTENKEFQ